MHIQDLLERAKAHLLKAQEYQKRYFDRHRRHQEHQVGDWVLLNTSNLHLATVRKLRQWFVGPFKVLQRMGKTAYKLDLQGRFTGVHNVFHVSQLRPHVPGGSATEPPQPVEVEGEAHYEVRHCSSIERGVVEGNIWLGGQDMAQNMMSGCMKASWSMPRTC